MTHWKQVLPLCVLLCLLTLIKLQLALRNLLPQFFNLLVLSHVFLLKLLYDKHQLLFRVRACLLRHQLRVIHRHLQVKRLLVLLCPYKRRGLKRLGRGLLNACRYLSAKQGSSGKAPFVLLMFEYFSNCSALDACFRPIFRNTFILIQVQSA